VLWPANTNRLKGELKDYIVESISVFGNVIHIEKNNGVKNFYIKAKNNKEGGFIFT
jgi:hypothetical protein